MEALATFGQLLVSGILIGLVFALVAVGLTLIFGVMNVVNFAHGEFLMLAMYVTFGLSLVGLNPIFAEGTDTQRNLFAPSDQNGTRIS